MVGDIDREAATGLVARYLGALPARPRIGDKTLSDLRTIARPRGPIVVEESIDARTPQAAVFAGFFGVDLSNVRDTRLLNVAARVLSTRMMKTIREGRQLVYSIGASSEPAVIYPGFGLFAAVAPTDPSKAPALAAAVEEMYAELAKAGPTADELDVAKRQMTNLLDEILKDPELLVEPSGRARLSRAEDRRRARCAGRLRGLHRRGSPRRLRALRPSRGPAPLRHHPEIGVFGGGR